MTTSTVGNSMQPVQVSGPDQAIQEHTVQEDPEKKLSYLTLPDVSVFLDRYDWSKGLDQIYQALSAFNKQYKLSDDDLRILQTQGFIPFYKSVSEEMGKKADNNFWQNLGEGIVEGITFKEEDLEDRMSLIGREAADVLVGILAPIFSGQPWLILLGLIPAAIDAAHMAIAAEDAQHGQDIIDHWYSMAKQKLSSGQVFDHFTLYFE